jgi:flagellar hook-associated protein FlgK
MLQTLHARGSSLSSSARGKLSKINSATGDWNELRDQRDLAQTILSQMTSSTVINKQHFSFMLLKI